MFYLPPHTKSISFHIMPSVSHRK